MILRKPYAFLIRHFRLIHIIMLTIMSYILYKTISIRSFIDSYISSGQRLKGIEDLSNEYIGFLLIFSVIFMVLLSGVILYLLKHKKKPFIFYIVMITSYGILFFILLYSRSFLYDLNFTTPDLRFTRIIRDIYTIEMFIEIVVTIFVFVRAIGFDIKRFDFKKDMLEFKVSNEDDAEFEFQVELDKDEINARIRRFKRHFKYYYKENKIVFLLGVVIVLGIVTTVILRNTLNKEKIFKENEMFNTRLLSITVLDSYKTNVDYKGKEINKNKYYAILKLRYRNNSNQNIQLNTENARLSYDEYNSVIPTFNYYDKFSEYGVPYFSQILHSGETRDFIFVYELDKEFIDNDLTLKYLYDVKVVNKEMKYLSRSVKLNPKMYFENNLEDIKTMDTKEKGEELTFSDSMLKDTKLVINDFNISDRFQYGLLKCTTSCNKSVNYLTASNSANQVYSLTLARVDYNLEYDKSFGSYEIDKFFEKYGSIRFVVNGKEYVNKTILKDVSPYPSSNFVFMEVSDNLKKAEKIYLDITIKDKKYTYIVMDKTVKEETGEENKKDENVNNEITSE